MDKTEVLVALLAGPARLDPRLHANKARVRQALQEAPGRRREGEAIHGTSPRVHGRVAATIRHRAGGRPGRHRCRGPGSGHRRRHPRRELRPARGSQSLVHRVGRTARAGRWESPSRSRRGSSAPTSSAWHASSSSTPHIVEMFSSDPRLKMVGTGEVEGNAARRRASRDRPAAAGAYAKLAGRRSGGRRRR